MSTETLSDRLLSMARELAASAPPAERYDYRTPGVYWHARSKEEYDALPGEAGSVEDELTPQGLLIRRHKTVQVEVHGSGRATLSIFLRALASPDEAQALLMSRYGEAVHERPTLPAEQIEGEMLAAGDRAEVR